MEAGQKGTERPKSWAAWQAQFSPALWPVVLAGWALEWLVYYLNRTALVAFLQILATFAIPVAAVRYFLEAKDRDLERLYKSGEVIAASGRSTVDAARRSAMEDLVRHRLSIAGSHLPDGTHLEGIDLRGGDLSDAVLRGTFLMNARLGCREPVIGARVCTRLVGVDLRRSDLSHADLTKADLRRAILDSADLDSANLKGAILTGASVQARSWEAANLEGAVLDGTDFSGVNMEATDLTAASLTYAKMREVDLSGSRLRRADLTRSELNLADLRQANLADARLQHANLTGADLSAASLENADLSNAQLTRADLTGACLAGVDLSNAMMLNTIMQDVQGWRAMKSVKGAVMTGIQDAPSGLLAWAVSEGALSKDTIVPDQTEDTTDATTCRTL